MDAAASNPLLTKVYMPNGALHHFGFFGGGPASDKQKNYLRALLRQHAGDPTAEAIRAYMNELRDDQEAVISVSDVAPAIRYLKNLGDR